MILKDAGLQEYNEGVQLWCWPIPGGQEKGRRLQHYDIRDGIKQHVSVSRLLMVK